MKSFLVCALIFVEIVADVKPIYELKDWWNQRGFEHQNSFRSEKIIGGQESLPNEFPYQVALLLFVRDTTDIALCSGSLISEKHVITAAHCIDSVVALQAVFGVHYLNKLDGTQEKRNVLPNGFIPHGSYNKNDLSNDIALIKLPTPVITNEIIQIIELPTNENLWEDFSGELATVSGWGRFSSSQASSKALRYVEVGVITNEICRQRFPTRSRDSTICTSGYNKVGICKSDSGSPLTLLRNGTRLLIGIASFISGAGCESGFPSGYTRVTSFLPWIRLNIK